MRYLSDLEIKEKTVFLRVDFNVPLKDGVIQDDTRIKESLETIKYIIRQNAKLILASHLGRPKGEVVKELSFYHIKDYLSEILEIPVQFVNNCVGDEVEKSIKKLKNGEVLLLENLRFHEEEEKNDAKFSKQLASLAEVYVNDAFGTAHRKHASTYGMAEFFSPENRGAGFIIQKELKYLKYGLKSPKRPFLLILGGAKVKDKIPVIMNLINKVDNLIIGGAMAYTFLAVKGSKTGNSLVEKDNFKLTREILRKIREKAINFELPLDHIVVKEVKEDARSLIINSSNIPKDYIGLDIGPKTVELFCSYIEEAGTILWNGPMGLFEMDNFSHGTTDIAKCIAKTSALTIVGGGDSVSSVHKAGVAERIKHISTGGGASLELLAGLELPALKVLEEDDDEEEEVTEE